MCMYMYIASLCYLVCVCVCVCPQDVQLWEDLCQLEGELGMRYLTHDAEDTFWENQGARTHPLVLREREVERKKNMVHSYQNVTIPPVASSGSKSTTTDADLVSNSSVATEDSSMLGEEKKFGSRSTLCSDESGRTGRETMHMSDEEVIISEKHAQRVGYKVSTV